MLSINWQLIRTLPLPLFSGCAPPGWGIGTYLGGVVGFDLRFCGFDSWIFIHSRWAFIAFNAFNAFTRPTGQWICGSMRA